jgi:hypothetical protein
MTDAYKVGVKLVMSSNAMPLLSALSKKLLGLDKQVAKLAKSWTGVGLAIKGAMAFWAADKIFTGLASIVDKTKELSHELTQVRKLGNQSEADMTAVWDKARSVGRDTRGISYADIVKIYSNVYDTVGGNRAEALALMGPLARFDVVAGNTMSKFGQSLDPNFNRDVIKGAEQTGWLTDKSGNYDPKRFAEYQDMITKLMTISHGAINPQTMRAEATTGGPALMGMDKESLMITAILGQYMGPSRTGTAAMSLMQQFAGGTMFKRNAEALQDIGMLGKDEWKVSGGRVILSPEARKRLGDLASDPLKLIETLKKDMVDHGITDQDGQIKELFAIFARQTTQRYMADLLRNESQILKAVEVSKTALGVDDSYKTQQGHDVEQKLADISTAYGRFWNVVAGADNKNLIPVLDQITSAIEAMTEAAGKVSPETFQKIATGIGILGVALAGGGVVSILAMLGPAGWVAGVVIALGTLAALNWGAITSGLTAVGDKLAEWYHGFAAGLAGVLSKDGAEYGTPEALAHKFTLGEINDTLTGKKNTDALERNTKELEDLNNALKGIGMPINYSGPGAGGDGARLINASYETVSRGLGGSVSTGGGAGSGGGSSSSTGGGPGAGIAHYGNLAMGGGDVNAAIAVGAAAAGMDVPHFKAMASIESSLNPTSNWNKHTQYKGLFQIGRSEWARFGHGNIFNAKDNAMAMAALVNANRAIFRKRFGRDPTPDEIYLMHQQGPGFFLNGAMTNIGGNPYPGMRGPQNHNSFLNGWSAEVERRAHVFGGSAIPPARSQGGEQVQIHKHYLDGRQIAARTMSHIAKDGNSSASGGRMYDRSYTRPISI